jgi:hypothetical protein
MKVIGQLYALAALPAEKEHAFSLERKVGRTPVLFWVW